MPPVIKVCRYPPVGLRRSIYALVAAIMAFGHVGSSALLGSDGAAPVLFALACAMCIVGVIRPRSHTIWAISGAAVFVSWAWRLIQILLIALGVTSQEPPDSTAMAAAAYLFCCITVWPAWRWLRPRTKRG